MTATPKQEPLRDRKYLDWLHDQRCLFSGRYGSPSETIDPCHLGTLGMGIKSPDDEVIPLAHEFHRAGHQGGEISMLRALAPDDVILSAFKALARQMYRAWQDDGQPPVNFEAWAIELCTLLDAIEQAYVDADFDRVRSLLAGRLDIARKHGLEVKILGEGSGEMH